MNGISALAHLWACAAQIYPTYQGQRRGKPYLEVWSSPQLKMAGMNIPNAVKFGHPFGCLRPKEYMIGTIATCRGRELNQGLTCHQIPEKRIVVLILSTCR